MSLMPAKAATLDDIIKDNPGILIVDGNGAVLQSATTCFNIHLVVRCGPCETGCYAIKNYPSIIMNGGMRYYTWSYDYKSRTDPSGCSPCGGVQSGSAGARLPELEITRFFEPISWGREHLTFGKNHGLKKYDQRLYFTSGHTAINFEDYGGLHSKRGLQFNTARQCWIDAGRDQGIASLHLFDDAGLPIITGATRDNAHTGIILNYDGSAVHFEILWDANGKGVARPSTFLDRHGNAVEIEYVDPHPVFGTPATENFRPYFRKTVIRDASGREAQFTYQKLFHRYVTTNIDLPNGGSITYDYSWNGGVQLDKVTHADSTESLWGLVKNNTTKLDEFTIFDAKSDPGHRRKRIYFSQGQGFAPGGGTISTVRARVRRAQNGEGEFVWDTKFTNNLDERYVYDGGNSLRKLSFYSNGKGLGKVEHINNDLWKGDFHQGDASTWTKETQLDNRQNNSKHFPVADKDTRNRIKSNTRDLLSNEKLGEQYADGTAYAKTRNQFTQPLISTDRLGRITTNTYSPFGDLLSETRATGTSDETTRNFIYNTRGQVIEARDALYDANTPELHNTRYEYDANGFLVKKIDSADVTNGARPETVFFYDTAGRMTSITDPVGRVVSYEYDLENRLIKTTYNDTSTELVEYGAGLEANLVIETTDRNGIETAYEYDAADRRTKTTVASNTSDPSVEICTYLVGTRKKETCTINGEKTTYLFDHRNRVIGSTVTATANTTLTTNTEYDELDRQRSTTDAYGRKTYYLYDQNDRVIRTVTETVPGALAAPAFTQEASQTSQSKVYTLTDKAGNQLDTEDTHEVTYTDPRDLFLLGLTRDLTANASYLITDTIYDAEGQSLISTDARGNNSWTEYDELGRTTLTIIAVGTPEEIRTEQDYDDNSNLVESRSPRFFDESINTKDQYAYNGRNLRASHTTAPNTPEEATQEWTYYLDGRNYEHKDFRGNIAKQIWHACCGRLQASIQRDGTSTTIHNTDYKGQATHTSVLEISNLQNYNWHNPTDADTLRETTTRFDGRGRPTHSTVWLTPLGTVDDDARISLGDPTGIPIAGLDGIPSTDGLTTTYTYDDDLTDGIGIDLTYAAQLTALTTRYGYNPFDSTAGVNGYAVAVTNPAGETSVQITDGAGRTILTINPEGNIATMEYDEVIAASQITNPQLPIPGALLVTTATDANGNSNSSYSDGAGRTIATEDAEGNLSAAAYNANSSVIITADANGLGQTCAYDALNRPTVCADLQETAEGKDRTTTYNTASQVVTSTNADGEITSNAYDERNRLINTTDANNITTSYLYDTNNNLITLIDGKGNQRQWFFDTRNLNVTKVYPGNSGNDFYTQNFDALGRVSIKVDQIGTTCSMIYDLASRMTEKQYHTGATPAQGGTVTQGPTLESTDTFSYDAASRITQTLKGRHSITTSHTYALDSQPLTETVVAGNRSYTSTRTYDAANRPLTHTYPNGKTTHWAYTARNLVNTVHYEDKIILTNTHDAGYRLTDQVYGNGLEKVISYNRQDNLRTSDQVFDGNQTLDDLNLSYSYAADKQITAENIVGDNIQNTSFTASYDAGNRITNWQRAGGFQPPSQTWSYDDSGNWDSTTKDGNLESRTHSDSDQITQIAGNAATHDAKGNLTDYEINSKVYEVEYDLDNRIIKVDVNNSDVEYRYDALGRRVIRKEGRTKTALIWWGNSENAEHKHRAGQTTIQNDIMSHPTRLNSVIARAVLGRKSKLQWYHKNYLDHVYAVSNKRGKLIEHYRYTAFGEVTIYNRNGAKRNRTQINNHILWNTRRQDTVTGHYLYKYRHYDPQLGRWPSRDPIEE
ncbi:MAG: RHS repeat-associated protein, partial [Rubritalea sp.]